MIFRLKCSKNTEEVLNDVKSKFLITPNILLRIAVSLSLRQDPLKKEDIKKQYLLIDNTGLEFQRHTLTGENESLYKILMTEYCNESLTDEDFFPIHFKFHMERGISLLKTEIEYAPNFEIFLKNLLDL